MATQPPPRTSSQVERVSLRAQSHQTNTPNHNPARRNPLLHNPVTHAVKVTVGGLLIIWSITETSPRTAGLHRILRALAEAYHNARFPPKTKYRQFRQKRAAKKGQVQQVDTPGAASSSTSRPPTSQSAAAGNLNTTTAGSSSGTRRV